MGVSALTDKPYADEFFYLRVMLDSRAKKISHLVRGIAEMRACESTFGSKWRRLCVMGQGAKTANACMPQVIGLVTGTDLVVTRERLYRPSQLRQSLR